MNNYADIFIALEISHFLGIQSAIAAITEIVKRDENLKGKDTQLELEFDHKLTLLKKYRTPRNNFLSELKFYLGNLNLLEDCYFYEKKILTFLVSHGFKEETIYRLLKKDVIIWGECIL